MGRMVGGEDERRDRRKDKGIYENMDGKMNEWMKRLIEE